MQAPVNSGRNHTTCVILLKNDTVDVYFQTCHVRRLSHAQSDLLAPP